MKLRDSKLPAVLGALATLLAALLALGQPAAAAPVWFQEEEEDGAKDDAEEEDEEEEERWFAIVGGDVYTGTGAVLRNATILGRNGIIHEIGHDPFLPEGTEVLDATGYRVYPGFVAIGATSRIAGGLFSAEEPPEEDDHDPHYGLDDTHGSDVSGFYGHVETGDDYEEPFQAQTELKSDIEDSFDPFSQYLVLALATGITTAEQSNAAIKLKRGEIEGVLLREKNLTTVAWSVSNPSSIRSARKKFAAAAEYLRKLRAWEELSSKEQKEKKEPSKKGVDANVVKILRGDTLARFNAQDREDLIGIARFAQEHHFRPVVFGCREGWTVAEELGKCGAYAILTPRDRAPKDERLVRPGGSSIENAAILHRAGVQVAIRPSNTSFDLGGITGRDLLHLPVEAAFGVRGGLPEEAALHAITIVPARILGVDHRVGTLELGKDLDAIVTDGDALHYETFVQYTVVAGKLCYDKQEEIFFAHIRPRPEREEPEPEEAEEEPQGEDEDEGEDEGEDEADDGADDEADDENGDDDAEDEDPGEEEDEGEDPGEDEGGGDEDDEDGGEDGR